MKPILILIGLGLVGFGCFWHYPPLAPIVMGSLFLSAGIVSHFYSTRKRPIE